MASFRVKSVDFITPGNHNSNCRAMTSSSGLVFFFRRTPLELRHNITPCSEASLATHSRAGVFSVSTEMVVRTVLSVPIDHQFGVGSKGFAWMDAYTESHLGNARTPANPYFVPMSQNRSNWR